MQYSLKPKHFIIRPFSIILLFTVLLISSCTEDSLPTEISFYHYDFETDYTNIDSVYVSEFNGSKVLGPFNNSGFSVHWAALPDHEYIKLSYDLYIHDSWEGNTNNINNGQPDHDAWMIEFDPHLNTKVHEKIYFETSFSNGLCEPGFCFSQSFPNQFPFANNAKEGALSKKLKGRCLYKDSPIGTTLYRMNQVFPHKKREVVIAFYDKLKQKNPFPHLCEESWSLDNLSISLIKY